MGVLQRGTITIFAIAGATVFCTAPSEAQRTCSRGKPCGNTCIAQHLTCRVDSSGSPSTPRHPRASEERAVRGSEARQVARHCRVDRIIDGDTLVCGGERIRLLLIDAPERSQGEYGVVATAALERIAPVGTRVGIELDVQERDRYGRTLAYLWTDEGRMVNEELARAGMVVVSVYPPNIRHVDRLRAAVADARMNRRGLWSNSAFECDPADHRRGRCR